MKRAERNRSRGKTAKMAVAALSALLVLSFTAYRYTAQKELERQREELERQQEELERQREELERLRVAQERAEQHRQMAAERQKILESPLFTSAQEYVLDVLEEVSPDCEYEVSLDEGGYYGATDETLAGVVDTADAAKAFFDIDTATYFESGYRLMIEGNWPDVYGHDPEPLLKALMEHGISGGLLDGQFRSPVYSFDAETGEWNYNPWEGY